MIVGWIVRTSDYMKTCANVDIFSGRKMMAVSTERSSNHVIRRGEVCLPNPPKMWAESLNKRDIHGGFLCRTYKRTTAPLINLWIIFEFGVADFHLTSKTSEYGWAQLPFAQI